MVNNDNDLISTTEAAEILGISRVAVFKRIKSGELPAQKVGRNYVIERGQVLQLTSRTLNQEEMRDIDQAVGKAVAEYREAFDLS